MHVLSRLFSEALSTVSVCFPPLTSCLVKDDKTRPVDTITEKKTPVAAETMPSARPFQSYPQQPIPLPYHGNDGNAAQDGYQDDRYGQSWDESERAVARPCVKEKAPRKSFSSSIRGFSIRKLNKSSLRGRPHISAPTNFRHLYHDTVNMSSTLQEPRGAPRPRGPRPASFRPLQLSMHMSPSEHHLSPLLPHFTMMDRNSDDHGLPPPPAPAHARNQHSIGDASTLVDQRSASSMSIRLPRRDTFETLSTPSASENAPSPPPKSKARSRAHTSPNTQSMLERIASALIEREIIQEQLDDVIERQSIYSCSRPSTAHGMRELEPMPSIPALPPTEGLTFAERVSTPAPLVPDRPRTAPLPRPTTPASQTGTAWSGTEMSLPQASPLRTVANRTPPPPLPLVLRPPLRKKKSFSRVSSWLVLGGGQEHQASRQDHHHHHQHGRSFSSDSITNQPRPVKNNEGFYQCLAPGSSNQQQQQQRTSFYSVSSVSSWSTCGGEEPTAAAASASASAAWSPGPSSSSPGSSRAAAAAPTAARNAAGPTLRSGAPGPHRAGTFGQVHAPRRESVGVAF